WREKIDLVTHSSHPILLHREASGGGDAACGERRWSRQPAASGEDGPARLGVPRDGVMEWAAGGARPRPHPRAVGLTSSGGARSCGGQPEPVDARGARRSGGDTEEQGPRRIEPPWDLWSRRHRSVAPTDLTYAGSSRIEWGRGQG
ncbi:unnamed protein product, partial [Urochloa humidicola]